VLHYEISAKVWYNSTAFYHHSRSTLVVDFFRCAVIRFFKLGVIMLYVDIPTAADLTDLASGRADICVSIYLRTTPVTRETTGDRITLKNLAKEAVNRLEVGGAERRRVAALSEQLDDLVEDNEFWRFQARSLAIFATPDNVKTFRVPNALESLVVVSDRFHLKPLLRTVTFSNAAYVLALSEDSVRLVEVFADLPAVTVKVEGLPKDAASAVGRATINDRSPRGRLHGSEGQKVLLRQFARKVDKALRGLLAGSDIPLVLAATQPLASIYRSVNTYPDLVQATIEGSPGALTDGQLAERARLVLDSLYQNELASLRALFEIRENQGRATTDVAQAARAATFGAVAVLLVDIDEITLGTVDDEDGTVAFTDQTNATSYGVVDEIASRVIRSGGRVLGVRKDDIPYGKSLAAILRYAA
jgi:hypothetical protein